MNKFSRKFLGIAIASVLLATVTFAAPAAKPKATGDADWVNGDSFNEPANLTFNAISINADGDAKGSAIYTDANITYTMDVKFLKVAGNEAWFVGTVTSVSENNLDCCVVGNWILYKVVDGGEPGIGAKAFPVGDRRGRRHRRRLLYLAVDRGGQARA